MSLLSNVQWWPCQEDIQHSVHKSFYHLQNGDDLSIIPIIRLMKHCTFRMVTISPKCHALSNLLTEMLHIWAQFTWLPHLHQRCCGQTASHPPPSVLVASAQPVSEVKQTCVCYADSNTMWSTELSSGKVFSTISVVFNLYHHHQIQLKLLPFHTSTQQYHKVLLVVCCCFWADVGCV